MRWTYPEQTASTKTPELVKYELKGRQANRIGAALQAQPGDVIHRSDKCQRQVQVVCAHTPTAIDCLCERVKLPLQRLVRPKRKKQSLRVVFFPMRHSHHLGNGLSAIEFIV